MPPLVIGGTLLEGVVVIQHPTISSVEEGLPSGEVASEAKQVDKDAKFVQAPISSVVQDLGATQTPIPKDPKPGQSPSLARTVIAEQVVELVVVEESFAGMEPKLKVKGGNFTVSCVW